MSHFLTVPINANGIIVDEKIDTEIAIAAIAPFKFTDVFVYSHGWWNTASNAAAEYNIFSIGFAKTFQQLAAQTPPCLLRVRSDFAALAMALHWPSMISEDQNSVANFLEAMSFFTMEHRADDVGQHACYSLLRLLIEARQGQPPLRFHLIGHSFGCRVVLSALQALAVDSATMALAIAAKAEFRVALVQAAADAGSLAKDGMYANVLGGSIPDLRMLVTTSKNDAALGTWYPNAQKLAHLFRNPVPALGSAGPTGNLAVPISDQFTVDVAPVHQAMGQLAVADLTPVHNRHQAQYYNGQAPPAGGQHSDINLPEIYEMLARFLGN